MKSEPTVPNGQVIYTHLVHPYDTLIFGGKQAFVREARFDAIKGEVTLTTEDAVYIFDWSYEVEVIRSQWVPFEVPTRFDRAEVL